MHNISRRAHTGSWKQARENQGPKHRLDIRTHFANEVIQNGHMKLMHVSTSAQLADILTTPLHFPYLEQEDNYHLRDLHPQEGGLSPRLSSRVVSALKTS